MANLLLSVFLSLQAADVGTSCHALSAGYFREGNGLMPSTCAGIVPVKIGAAAGIVTLTQVKVKREHRKWVYLVVTGISAYPVVHNVRALQARR